MDFRKEELPACFSDAESVLSPSQKQTERPILTDPSQHPDVPAQPRSTGEGRDNGDGRAATVDQGEDPESRPENERQIVKPGRRKRMSPSQWFKPSAPVPGHEIEAMDELETFTTAQERRNDH